MELASELFDDEEERALTVCLIRKSPSRVGWRKKKLKRSLQPLACAKVRLVL